MIARNTLELQQYQDGFPLPGFWKLAPEHAVTLNPTEAGVLRIAQGQVWATLDGPHHGPANDWGDVVLHGGEQLQLMPGQHVVVEPFGDAVNEPVYFSWEPSSVMAQAALQGSGPGWPATVAEQPAKTDDEVSIFLRATGRLFSRLGDFLMQFVAGKGRVLSPLETNQP